jgi:hypothetical protein
MLAAETPSPWTGVLLFGFFAVLGLGGAWGLRWQLAHGRTHRAGEGQQRLGMWIALVVGIAALALALRELFRALF